MAHVVLEGDEPLLIDRVGVAEDVDRNVGDGERVTLLESDRPTLGVRVCVLRRRLGDGEGLTVIVTEFVIVGVKEGLVVTL